MLGHLVRTFSHRVDLGTFVTIVILAAAVLVTSVVWLLKSGSDPESRFRVREADLPKNPGPAGPGRTQSAAPLRLEGIRLDLPPHQLLGVRENAAPSEVQKAYRELMKRYHPDLVGPPGSREWKDAQKIAEAIIRAKEALLKKR